MNFFYKQTIGINPANFRAFILNYDRRIMKDDHNSFSWGEVKILISSKE